MPPEHLQIRVPCKCNCTYCLARHRKTQADVTIALQHFAETLTLVSTAWPCVFSYFDWQPRQIYQMWFRFLWQWRFLSFALTPSSHWLGLIYVYVPVNESLSIILEPHPQAHPNANQQHAGTMFFSFSKNYRDPGKSVTGLVCFLARLVLLQMSKFKSCIIWKNVPSHKEVVEQYCSIWKQVDFSI